MTNGGDPIALISLFSPGEEPARWEKDLNFTVEPTEEEVPMPEEVRAKFPKLANGDLDPAWIMLHIEQGEVGTRKKCICLPGGGMICY